jgi:hypothetical protein
LATRSVRRCCPEVRRLGIATAAISITVDPTHLRLLRWEGIKNVVAAPLEEAIMLRHLSFCPVAQASWTKS